VNAQEIRRLANDLAEAAVRKLANTISYHSEQVAIENKKAKVQAFVEKELKAGRIYAHELKPGRPGGTIVDRLMRADDRAIVRRFRENGKLLCLTELELQMDEIRRRRPRKFRPDYEEQVATVRRFAESHAKDFARMGSSPEKFVAGFVRAKARDGNLTAETFLRSR
jgi:hypothetical protein